MEPSRSSANRAESLPRYRGKEFPRFNTGTDQTLCDRWRAHHDISAAHQLVGNHLRLAGKIAEGYAGYGVVLQELIGEGCVGLMRAVCRFDPDRGVAFTTYATWYVREAIHEYLVRTRATPLLQMASFCNVQGARHQQNCEPVESAGARGQR
jgi:DNA-directed RNA polymerase sigma subunit (sigma70/sigma32)